MRIRITTPCVVSAVFASAVLMTACGSESARPEGARPDGGGEGRTATPSGTEKDGVRITGSIGSSGQSASADFEVTNRDTEPFTYTITFEVLSDSGGVMANERQTVFSVGPGRTVKDTVRTNTPGRVRVGKVRRVPSAEAPDGTGACPPAGVRVTADEGDAAMGLRVVGLHLENCGTRPYTVEGYPLLGLLDEDRKPVSGIGILHGSGDIATMKAFDEPPRPVVLKPGETASAGLMWRNTTGAGDAVNVPYVRVEAKPGAQPMTVVPELDLGTTGKLGVGPWKKDTPQREGARPLALVVDAANGGGASSQSRAA
ncbi:DUF4232 domain-containing protein [Streptomyces abikoensis]|uniref:DUF4232 domain-containing protein n=1 Tax=Streptomyces abikoensis TaxID=97398 RepID=UPI00167654C2|nr:DUF4232 domain-containing protein [Streptomyces abikoensis]